MIPTELTEQPEHAEPVSLRDNLLSKGNAAAVELLDAEHADRLARIVAALDTPRRPGEAPPGYEELLPEIRTALGYAWAITPETAGALSYGVTGGPDNMRASLAYIEKLAAGQQAAALAGMAACSATGVDIQALWAAHGSEQVEQATKARAETLADKYGSAKALKRQTTDNVALAAAVGKFPRALWGKGLQVLWARNEALMIESSIRVGKTTLAGILIRAMVFGGDVAGYPVRKLEPGERILYVAADRPAQGVAALRRQFTAREWTELDASLDIWQGWLLGDAAEHLDVLADTADCFEGIAVVILDSLKDAAVGLSDEKVGQRYHYARQKLIASGRQLIELHHLNKSGGDYGSTFIHAGAGSVLRLSGRANRPTVTLTQVLPAAELVPPVTMTIDRTAGTMTVKAKPRKAAADGDAEAAGEPDAETAEDLVAWVMGQGQGVTASEAAMFLYGSTERGDVEKARRALNACPELRCEAARGRGAQSRWYYIDADGEE
jgi:hypothetical protein